MPSKKTPPKKPAKKPSHLPTPTLFAQVKAEAELTRELKELTKQVEKLRDADLMENFKKPGKFLWFSFLKGVMMGFGSVLGASLLVGIAVYLMGQIQLVPVVGDFVKGVLTQIDSGQVFEESPK
jgi:hypothetical protein